jgi:hypothetical protein
MVERGAQSRFQFPRIFNVPGKNTACISPLRKIRVIQIRAEGGKFCSLYFEFHEAQGLILIDDNFHRRLQLPKRKQFAHQHGGKPAIAREGYHLAIGKSSLSPDRLRHRVGHRTMNERSQHSALAIHGKCSARSTP